MEMSETEKINFLAVFFIEKTVGNIYNQRVVCRRIV